MEQVLATVDGALKDPVIGLAAAAAALANNDDRIQTEFAFVQWSLVGTMSDTRLPNVMLRPRRWLPATKRADIVQRDADVAIDIGYEFFGSDVSAIQDNIAIMATALAQVIDALRAYSDANDGTIIDVYDPVLYEFGQFAGPVSNGFLATITLAERSDL